MFSLIYKFLEKFKNKNNIQEINDLCLICKKFKRINIDVCKELCFFCFKKEFIK